MSARCFPAVGVVHGAAVKFLAVLGGMLTPFREVAVITVAEIEVMIYVAIEVVVAVEPWTSSNKYPAVEPFRAVIPVRGATVRRNFVIAVGANGGRTDLYRDLGIRFVASGRNQKGRACQS
jgi:hypothetical protein